MLKKELEQKLKESETLSNKLFVELNQCKIELKEMQSCKFEEVKQEKNYALNTVRILEDICMALITNQDPRLERTKVELEHNKIIDGFRR